MKKINLTLCMIVKNEQRMLEECLESVQKLVDQIIIVDTGSTDETIKIAQKFDAEIVQFEWIGDFSAARNESIKYAKGNWILWLDADERLNPESISEINNIIKTKPVNPTIYKINIKNFQKGGDYYYISDAHRLFSNNFGIEFSGRIHEQISPSLKKIKGKEYQTNIEILHHGYNLDENEQDKKNNRNRELLKKMVKDQPDYAYGHYTLAQNYAMCDESDKAAYHFEKALNLNQLDKYLTSSLHVTFAEVLIKMKNFELARKHIQESLNIEKLQTGAYYLLFKISEVEQDFQETEKWLKKLYQVNQQIRKSGKKNSTDVIIDDEKILQTLVNLYGKNKDTKKYYNTCKQILAINPTNNFANRGLINYYMDSKDFENAFLYLNNIHENFTINDEKYLDILSTIYLKNQQFEKSIFIYEIILKNNPYNDNAIKKIVGLLAKTGQRDKAEKILLLYQSNLQESRK